MFTGLPIFLASVGNVSASLYLSRLHVDLLFSFFLSKRARMHTRVTGVLTSSSVATAADVVSFHCFGLRLGPVLAAAKLGIIAIGIADCSAYS